ncbi:hypothetical protein N836_24155 [Leptolyngbya sp. Heron Island J]|uniref:hypothetical protein n=1 Tax=Leptolyngbya sp. Heron Island J TaxID=1385935 RepID=UPI0003B9BAE5|nr:hypothetical protein [Leptolyngbya sp. Heron Island J]ESA32884.1 hypothetical protein N836_24155 [Leptolyngbya sp. Heron Island J]
MSPVPSPALENVIVGNDAGWILAFYREKNRAIEKKPVLVINSAQYHAEIQATLPGGLEGGTYSFVVEGLIDEHYGQLTPKLIVRLYLYWRDTNRSVTGYLANLVGITGLTDSLNKDELKQALVAELAIVSVSRKLGAKRYETTIQAQERIFKALSKRVIKPLSKVTPLQLLQKIQKLTGTEIKPYGLTKKGLMPGTKDLSSAATGLEKGNTYVKEIADLAAAMEAATGKYGRGMVLIRNGVLHFGPRPIPLKDKTAKAANQPKRLTLRTGLIEAKVEGLTDSDPFFDDSKSANPSTKAQQRQFTLTLKGRPDLKPGDLVQFEPPKEDVIQATGSLLGSLVGAFGGSVVTSLGDELKHPVTLYITSVKHSLGKTSGFSTVVSGEEILDPKQPWDPRSPEGSQPVAMDSAKPTADTAVRAAQAVKQIANSGTASKRFSEVGEVRQVTTKGKGSETELPGQTLTVWRGLKASDRRSNQANRLAIERDAPLELAGVAYATPFAWGKCGLVLPRYPGTRVALIHRNGQAQDPLEVGALWEMGKGPDSQPGDWWLILPAEVPSEARGAIDEDAKPKPYEGKVTQDLIDAEGNRIIEVGELTIRVGKDNLQKAGERPKRPEKNEEKNSVTIEHTKEGSKIVMNPDGSVEITAKTIKLKSKSKKKEEGIELDAGQGTITMIAHKVDVQVSDSMNVH